MEAADESKRRGGRPVTIQWVMDRAKSHAPGEPSVALRNNRLANRLYKAAAS
jgi:hypothetical protein